MFVIYSSIGTVFHITATMITKNGTGTGENIISLDTVDHMPVYELRLLYPMKPGNYSVDVECNATPPPGCQTGDPCEQWLAGNYTVHFGMCTTSTFLVGWLYCHFLFYVCRCMQWRMW